LNDKISDVNVFKSTNIYISYTFEALAYD